MNACDITARNTHSNIFASFIVPEAGLVLFDAVNGVVVCPETSLVAVNIKTK